MKMVLFDLGNTLEVVVDGKDVLLPGARKTLQAIHLMRDAQGQAPVLALVSDFGDVPATPGQISASQKEYFKILKGLGIRSFFEPVGQHVTLSSEAGGAKPKKKIFSTAIGKVPGLQFPDVIFVTENLAHVKAARKLTMKAIHFKGPGEINAEVEKLVDLIPIIQKFLRNAA